MRFEKVDVLLLEPNPVLRRAIRDSLAVMGIRNITAVSTVPDLEWGLQKLTPDLVISDAVAAENAPMELTRAVRHGYLGENPFVSIMTTAEGPTLDLVKAAINSGTDGLIRKPFCMQEVIDRIQTVALFRKPFVVTRDYIGPCRRLAQREENSHPRIDAPNTLKYKVEGTYDRDQVRWQIIAARNEVDEQKASYDAITIGTLVSQIAAAVRQQAQRFPLSARLTQLHEAAQDITRRLSNVGESDLTALCSSLLTVIDKIRGDLSRRDPQDIELLENLAHAIQMAYQSDSRMANYAVNISTAIKGSRRYKTA
ncbi:MAG: response regulator [Alphaproteobacteria bacterium]|nr:response regulator [Alphaproteobacteria bacterium]